MPIELELELADNDAPIITKFNHAYTAEHTSTSWKIQNCQTKCDILSLANSLDNSYANYLLGVIHYKLYMILISHHFKLFQALTLRLMSRVH